MDELLADYEDAGPPNSARAVAPSERPKPGVLLSTRVSVAPPVSATLPAYTSALVAYGGAAPSSALLTAQLAGQMTSNLPLSLVGAPVAGPVNPYAPKRFAAGTATIAGTVAVEAVDSASFDDSMLTFQVRGVVVVVWWWWRGRGRGRGSGRGKEGGGGCF